MTSILIKNACDDFAITKNYRNIKSRIDTNQFETMIENSIFKKVYDDDETVIYVNSNAVEDIEAIPLQAPNMTAVWIPLQSERNYSLIKINKTASFIIKPEKLDSCLNRLMEIQEEKFFKTSQSAK